MIAIAPSQTNSDPLAIYTTQTRGTRFCKFQSAKLQELPDQVPVGHVPRCISVQIRGSLTRTMLPGTIGCP